MENRKIYLARIKSFLNKIEDSYYENRKTLNAEFIEIKGKPVAVNKIKNLKFKPINIGDVWGNLWDSAWFRFSGEVEPEGRGELAVLIDIEGEGAIFKNDSPYQGITHKHNSFVKHRKRLYFLEEDDINNGKFEILMEGAANEIIGSWGIKEFRLKQADVCHFNRDLWNLYHDISYFLNLYESLDENSVLAERIINTLNLVSNNYNGKNDIEKVCSILDKLNNIGKNPVDLNAVSIGHGHLDIAWLWPKSESRRKAGRTFSTAIKLIKEYPGYIFGASQPLLYQWVKEDYPELYNSIKDEVKNGNWECQGSMWVEPDTNLPSGESLIRHNYWGLKYYKDEFDIEIDNLWLPDVFGYPGSLPGILKGCGINSFLTTKLAWSETNDFPYDSFRWIGIDGQEVVTHLPPGKEYHTENFPKQLNYAQNQYKQKAVHSEFINLFGIGDGGGGPSRSHIEFGNRSKNQNGVPSVEYEKSSVFFDNLKSIKDDLPKWSGELYLEFHRGTYTSVAKLKKLNRKLEIGLRDLEILDSLYGKEDISKELESFWKVLLENQFHDILPGSSINIVNSEAIADLEEAIENVESQRDRIIKRKFSVVNYGSGNILLINTLSFPREEIIQLGNEAGCDILKVKVPSMGYAIIDPNKYKAGKGTVGGDILTMENSLVKYSLDPHSGKIQSIKLKGTGEIVENANRLLLWKDEPPRWDAWDISHYYRESEAIEAELVDRSLDIVNSNIIKITQTLKVGNSIIIQELILKEGSQLLEIKNQVDWNEERKLLRVESLTKIKSESANFEIPYGNIKRSTLNNNSWEKAQFEVPGHRYANLSDVKKGLSIISDSKYGYSSKEGSLSMSLLRSPNNPDTSLDKGVHTFTYCYYPHKDSFELSDTVNISHKMNNPLIIKTVQDKDELESFLNLDNDKIKVEVVKKSFDKDFMVLRLYETVGLDTHVKLNINKDFKNIYLANHLEIIEEELNFEDSFIELNFNPFEIKTLMFK